MTRQDFKEPISYQDISMLQAGYIEVYHSELRDENIKGKFYAYAKLLDDSGNYWTSDDYDTPEEAINDVKTSMKECGFNILYKNISDVK